MLKSWSGEAGYVLMDMTGLTGRYEVADGLPLSDLVSKGGRRSKYVAALKRLLGGAL